MATRTQPVPGGTLLALGLMSGTSRDGIDAALLRTDGMGRIERIGSGGTPYHAAFRERLESACAAALAMERPGPHPLVDAVAAELADLHAEAVHQLLRATGIERADIIGFHGHTVAHRPDRGWTWQIGDAARLASLTRTPVVADLRSADVAAGGQGAPLLPVYHAALLAGPPPHAVLNLGGIANVTLVASDGALTAFDTGPANALIDAWVQQEAGQPFDRDGVLAAAGQVDETVLTAMLDHPWFDSPPPKSLDREDFTLQPVRGLGLADGAATLTAFSAETVALGVRLLAERPRQLVVAGGGRRNPTLMRMIAERTGLAVVDADSLGWDGDALEAEGFAYMAVRARHGLPISFPGTTGAPEPMTGGVLFRPE